MTLTVVPKDKQQSVIRFLMLENVSGSGGVCCAECYHKINCEPMGTETAKNLKMVDHQKEDPGVVYLRHQLKGFAHCKPSQEMQD